MPADEPAAAAHQELAIPVVGQQQRELDLGADDAGRRGSAPTLIAPVSAAGTATASVTLTSGSLRVTRCEHSACSAAMTTAGLTRLRDEYGGDDRGEGVGDRKRVFMGA